VLSVSQRRLPRKLRIPPELPRPLILGCGDPNLWSACCACVPGAGMRLTPPACNMLKSVYDDDGDLLDYDGDHEIERVRE